jgi:hypothetical protein
MKIRRFNLFLFALVQILLCQTGFGQSTAFTYQGRLNSGTGPANGVYDFQFGLYGAATNGSQIGDFVTNSSTPVSNGLFTVAMDFGAVFPGPARWLEISVRTNGAGSFDTLSPRQALTSTPYAIFAAGANAAGLSGTISSSNIANGTITSNMVAAGSIGSNELAGSVGVWSKNGGSIFYNDGFVGIGTNSPIFRLDVIGRIRAQNALGIFTTDGFLPLNNTVLMASLFASSNCGPQLRFSGAGGGFIDIGQNSAGDFVVEGSDAPRLVVRNGGNVGIGTTNPPVPLEVRGLASTNTAQTAGVIQGIQTAGTFSGSGVYGLSLVPGGSGIIGQADVTVGPSGFPAGVSAYTAGTNGAALYAVSSALTGPNFGVWARTFSPESFAGYFQGRGYFSGNVGIGTNSPATQLHVSSTDFRTALIDSSSAIGTWLDLRNTASGTNWQFISTGSANGEGPGKLLIAAGPIPGSAASQVMVLTPSGNVGIGTNSPASRLHVSSTDSKAALVDSSSTIGTWLDLRNTASGTNWQFISTGSGNGEGPGKLLIGAGATPGGVSTEVMTLTPSGNVGIDNTAPAARLTITGGDGNDQGLRLQSTNVAGSHFWNIHIDANGDALVFSHDNQWPGINYSYLVSSSAGLITTSDSRVKKDIESIPSCLDRVLALTPSTFRYRQADENSPLNYGFIAQDVEKQFPDLVQERNGLKTLVGAGLTAINTRAIQDLNHKTDDRLQKLETENAELKQRLEALEKILAKRD